MMVYIDIENEDLCKEKEKERAFVGNMDWQEVVSPKSKKEEERNKELKRKRTEEEIKIQTAEQNLTEYKKKKRLSDKFCRERCNQLKSTRPV